MDKRDGRHDGRRNTEDCERVKGNVPQRPSRMLGAAVALIAKHRGKGAVRRHDLEDGLPEQIVEVRIALPCRWGAARVQAKPGDAASGSGKDDDESHESFLRYGRFDAFASVDDLGHCC